MPAATEEFFDVVDEFDVPIERMSRSEVHRLGLRHRAVHIFLFRTDGRILIHLRTPTKEEFPSVWTSSASGHVSAGESYSTAAERELLEELGVSASLAHVAKFDACAATSNEFTELYEARSDADIAVDSSEIADIKWVTLEEARARVEAAPDEFSPAFRLLFAAYLRTHP